MTQKLNELMLQALVQWSQDMKGFSLRCWHRKRIRITSRPWPIFSAMDGIRRSVSEILNFSPDKN